VLSLLYVPIGEDQATIWSGGADGRICVWDAATNELLQTVKATNKKDQWVYCLKLIDNDVWSASFEKVTIWDRKAAAKIGQLSLPSKGKVSDIGFAQGRVWIGCRNPGFLHVFRIYSPFGQRRLRSASTSLEETASASLLERLQQERAVRTEHVSVDLDDEDEESEIMQAGTSDSDTSSKFTEITDSEVSDTGTFRKKATPSRTSVARLAGSASRRGKSSSTRGGVAKRPGTAGSSRHGSGSGVKRSPSSTSVTKTRGRSSGKAGVSGRRSSTSGVGGKSRTGGPSNGKKTVPNVSTGAKLDYDWSNDWKEETPKKKTRPSSITTHSTVTKTQLMEQITKLTLESERRRKMLEEKDLQIALLAAQYDEKCHESSLMKEVVEQLETSTNAEVKASTDMVDMEQELTTQMLSNSQTMIADLEKAIVRMKMEMQNKEGREEHLADLLHNEQKRNTEMEGLLGETTERLEQTLNAYAKLRREKKKEPEAEDEQEKEILEFKSKEAKYRETIKKLRYDLQSFQKWLDDERKKRAQLEDEMGTTFEARHGTQQPLPSWDNESYATIETVSTLPPSPPKSPPPPMDMEPPSPPANRGDAVFQAVPIEDDEDEDYEDDYDNGPSFAFDE